MTNTHSRVRTTAASAVVALLATTAAGALAAPASAAPDQSVAGSSTVAMSIPDKGASTPASTAITIPAGKGQVKDVDISLNGLTHSCISDLVVTVVHNGVTATIMNGAGDCSDDGTTVRNLTFDDEATQLLEDPPSGVSPSGTYKPTEYSYDTSSYVATSLAVFDGAASGGTWELSVVDQYNGDQGSLAGWSIDVDYNDPAAPSGSVVIRS